MLLNVWRRVTEALSYSVVHQSQCLAGGVALLCVRSTGVLPECTRYVVPKQNNVERLKKSFFYRRCSLPFSQGYFTKCPWQLVEPPLPRKNYRLPVKNGAPRTCIRTRCAESRSEDLDGIFFEKSPSLPRERAREGYLNRW